MKPQKLFQHERTTADVPTCSCMFNVFVVVENEKERREVNLKSSEEVENNKYSKKKIYKKTFPVRSLEYIYKKKYLV